ncbi:MAG: immunoglobulin domain-containing protein [Verrucomicrobia bacterium]|nr:immunoglobulin domain-containing protein [Verrucomicrobiota bacterium]
MHHSTSRLPLHLVALCLLLLASLSPGRAATTIDISSEAVRSGVRRFGIGLAQHNYYDSHQMMKELLFRNPGFEGMLFQSVVRLGPGATADRVIEDAAFTQWPSGFWAGATYEIIWSSSGAKGRTGTILTSIAPNRTGPPNDSAGSTQGTTYVFGDSDGTRLPAEGDYMVLRKTHSGGTGGGAAFSSWQVTANGGGTVTTEATDLPPRPANYPAALPWSRQCARLDAAAAGRQAGVSGQFDTLQGFVRLRGQLRLAFRAKGIGGANRVQVSVQRGSQAHYLNQTVQLTSEWADYTIPFPQILNEPESVSGLVNVAFSATGQSALLLDDVSLRQTDSDAANPTEFRDEVVAAIAGLRPGILRYVNWQDLGNSLDNSLAPVFARQRSGYSVYATSEANMMPGLHEFLVLCEHLGTEPWYSMPVPFSTRETANLMEYLGGPTTTPYGAIRAALGHPAPWTGVFSRIHLEFGNENWNNSAYRGGAITAPVPCGNRASELFGVIKSSPYYSATQFQCLLGGQTANPGLNLQLHNASALHDSLNLAPYLSSRVDSFANNEELFGPLFAEPEWWSNNPSPTSGLMRLNLNNVQATSRPVPLTIYEVNLHTTQGSITQSALDTYTPSVGAALAVMDHMLVMLRELNCRDQLFFSLGGHRTAWTATDNTARTSALWGATIDMGKANRKRPHYHALQLVNDVLAGDMLRTAHTGDNPTWNVTNQNRVTFTGAHHLQSFAFRSGNQRSLVLFNLHRTDALAVNFTGARPPSGTVTLRRLTSANITDHNETADVVRPVTTTIDAFDSTQSLTLPPFSMSVLQWNSTGTTTPPATAAAPQIATQPQSQTVTVGGTTSFSIGATGTGLTYQWRVNGTAIASATAATLSITNAQATHAGTYTVVVTNAGGSVTSSNATLTVNPATPPPPPPAPVSPPATTPTTPTTPPTTAASAPTITRQPQSQTLRVGDSLTLSLSVTASPAPTFQWQRNSAALAGATSDTFQLAAVRVEDAGTYTCIVTNSAGSVTSSPATITVSVPPPIVTAAPTISTPPASLVVDVGQTAAFSVTASGTPAPSYQWRRNGTALTGATNTSLSITATRVDDAGNYDCVVTNSAGTITSAVATLTVRTGPRLTNLSIRTTISPDQPLMLGLVVTGSARDVLVRAIGPGLARFGVAGVLPDPRLVLTGGGATTGSITNDNWEQGGADAAIFQRVGAFPLSPGSLDAAIARPFPAQTYTATVTDSSGQAGVALVECYDAGGTGTGRLVNLATRTRLAAAGDTVICGLSVAGDGAQSVLIRAIGPSLRQFGVTDPLPAPRLVVFDSAGNRLADTARWSPELSPTFARVGAFALPSGSADSATVVRLEAGRSLTVQVGDTTGGSGEVLLEIYEVTP